MKEKLEDVMELTKIHELLNKKSAEGKKPSTVILWVLAILGAVFAVGIVSFLVYRFVTPVYSDDYDDDDFFDDFDDDYEDDYHDSVPHTVKE